MFTVESLWTRNSHFSSHRSKSCRIGIALNTILWPLNWNETAKRKLCEKFPADAENPRVKQWRRVRRNFPF